MKEDSHNKIVVSLSKRDLYFIVVSIFLLGGIGFLVFDLTHQESPTLQGKWGLVRIMGSG